MTTEEENKKVTGLGEQSTNSLANDNYYPIPSKKTLSLLTYNVGLLQFKLFGMFNVFSNPPFCEERLPYIVQKLAELSTKVDIMCLQECYDNIHFETLASALSTNLPFSCRLGSQGLLKFHNGLIIFSKFPISDQELIPLRQKAPLEKYLANKSNLICTVNVPTLGKFRIINMHTTAGGVEDPENPNVDKTREDELSQAWESAQAALEVSSQGSEVIVPIIIGDLNCGPEASASNFEFILNKGFRDTFHEFLSKKSTIALPNERKEEESLSITWDPKNPLNMNGPHAASAPQRCDHVLIPTTNLQSARNIQVVDAKVVLTESIVPLSKSKSLSTLSDHYGVLITLQIE